MNTTQFEEAKSLGAFGQFIGAVIVSDSGFTADAKKRGFRKVTRLNIQIAKKNYVELLNTSTGAKEAGIIFEQKRESFYNDEALNGFFCNLKSDMTKKYIRLSYDADKRNTVESVYLDVNGNIVGEKIDDVKHLLTPSYYKQMTQGGDSAREKVIAGADIDVKFLCVKIENIAQLKIGGDIKTDETLKKYIDYVR